MFVVRRLEEVARDAAWRSEQRALEIRPGRPSLYSGQLPDATAKLASGLDDLGVDRQRHPGPAIGYPVVTSLSRNAATVATHRPMDQEATSVAPVRDQKG